MVFILVLIERQKGELAPRVELDGMGLRPRLASFAQICSSVRATAPSQNPLWVSRLPKLCGPACVQMTKPLLTHERVARV